ncbi:MAG TPA: A/G-specific adenine glycosylase, partial [Gammaproteobacteria bacterium]|nr:A/G-specific adenine glycosylase [Gammaproteobacteria bacterium]
MTKKNPQEIFTKPILEWWHKSGRKDLPWQKEKSLYKTWVSEIMLQQTQVKTVIPYFLKFLSDFPSISGLANAKESEVMAHWSGLGYYSRARNLHKAATIIKKEYGGKFPQNFDQIVALPGIGPSTAGAILSLNKIEPRPIMDGNVKRVIARHFYVEGDLSKGDSKNRIWKLTESC